MPDKAPGMDEAGEEIGRAEGLLGDEGDDIFHVIVVKLARTGQKVEVRADRIPKITSGRVYTDLAADELERLPEYRYRRARRAFRRCRWRVCLPGVRTFLTIALLDGVSFSSCPRGGR